MLLQYGGSNYHCFKDDFDINLRLNNNCPEEISQGKDFTTAMCIKGANGAGKTNALKPMAFLSFFAFASFSFEPNEEIPIESYYNNNNPIYLYCEFRIVDEEFLYEITLTSEAIIKESLTNITGKHEIVFLREGNKIVDKLDHLSDFDMLPELRSNVSLISTGAQYNIDALQHFHAFFQSFHFNVNLYGFVEPSPEEKIHKFYYDNKDALTFVSSLLKTFDTGIEEISVGRFRNEKDDKLIYYPIFHHRTEGGIKKLRIQHQSSGTRRLYRMLGQLFQLIEAGNAYDAFTRVWLADELDLHLHSMITPEIIRLVEQHANVQLIFTCQNDKLMDQMGKYRTTIVEKENNESFVYRLDEISSDLLRNYRPISPHYEAGRLGGVPKIG